LVVIEWWLRMGIGGKQKAKAQTRHRKCI
jgi:hypothetical protein